MKMSPFRSKSEKLSATDVLQDSSVDHPQSPTQSKQGDIVEGNGPAGEQEHLHGVRLAAVAVSLMLSMFIVSLDNVS